MSYYRVTFSNLRDLDIRPIPIIRVAEDTRPPRRAVQALREGQVIVYPTDTVYGLGCRIDDERAVRRIFTIKNRPPTDPLPVLLADAEQVAEYAREVPERVRRLMARFWPGPLTLILRRSARVPPVVTGGADTVALRVPNHPIPRALVREAGVPIVGTSANSHGMPAPVTAQLAVFDLGDRVDLVLDGGRTPLGRESTVVDLTGPEPRIIREGAIPAAELGL
ncbi:MAG: L-threonylcarbamoyladenylate synthase [Armatimonadota bacterium]|nr:L-threonylcarbamoyladenylate synthase [Armatimonadota bacterium]MDR7438130.1 L-threonylcarbamoyladenylate synthase [Armatimonadota bacterium]MDR7471546.1 L-threonylcarbamoyladenylate synthase [Armatimonadota bacterium]MDR7507997.1 L-threonylcarbamoyladenylate synthase [Armatimonadota bacterium]MDR7509604.1 L-threonylcarbamoyladenylate synthase [Armatimonadota bacterium]